jgi:flavin-binding protein dodecin
MPSTRQHEVSREALGAVRVGISKSGESVRNIKGVWVAEQKVDVEGGEIVAFRVLPKISFVVD